MYSNLLIMGERDEHNLYRFQNCNELPLRCNRMGCNWLSNRPFNLMPNVECRLDRKSVV